MIDQIRFFFFPKEYVRTLISKVIKTIKYFLLLRILTGKKHPKIKLQR